MKCIHENNLEMAKRLADEVRDRYTWTDMDADAVEIMVLTQEYLNGLGYIDKESLLNQYWSDSAVLSEPSP